MKFSSKIKKCELSPILKFEPLQAKAEAEGKTIYHLNIGQPDIETPDVYFKALRSFESPVLEYGPSTGIPKLRKSVKDYFARINASIDEEDVLVTDGGSEALQIIMSCILEDGDEIIIPEPFYSNYSSFINITGASIKPIPTSASENYHYADRARIESCITENTRAMMITNPGNPTGAVLTPDELKLVLDVCKDNDLFLIADEVYREFVYDGQDLISILQYEGYDENSIVIDSISKRFSACGARIGFLITKNKALMSEAMKLAQGRLCCPTIDQIAASELYELDPSYFDPIRKEYTKRRQILVDGLDKIPGIIRSDPEGAFYIMACLPVDDADKFQTWLLSEYDNNGDTVMFSPAENFYGTPGKGINEVRLAYVTNEQKLARSMEILKDAIEVYNSRN